MYSPISTSFSYTKDMLYALAKLQFSLVHAKFKIIYQMVCWLLIIAGVVAPVSDILRLIMLMAGCLAFPSLYMPAKLAAERVGAYYGENLPHVSYQFDTDDFTRTVDDTPQSFDYQTLTRLAEDLVYLYLVDDENTVFILPRYDIGDERAISDLKDLLAAQSNLKWGPLNTGLNSSIYTLIKKFKH